MRKSFTPPNTSAASTPDFSFLQNIADPKAWQGMLQQGPASLESFAASLTELGVTLDTEALARLQSGYMEELGALWQSALVGKIEVPKDKRFAAPAWSGNPLAAFEAASYLLNAKYLNAMADAVQAAPKLRNKLRFTVQQMVDALSPANFLATNPEAQQKLMESKGESLIHGMHNMLADLKKGHISQSDEEAFEVGKNVATSEGAVVFENELFQLLQFKPLTKTVHEKPLLLVPPCINKYYILDLQPDNSVVRYAVEQGHTVFLVSWRNPGPELGHKTWDDYVEDGIIAAIRAVQAIRGQDKFNIFGFCIGGTLLSCGLAVLAARGEQPAASLTLLTSFLDFSDVGAIEVYVDEMQVGLREQQIGAGGLMAGREIASAFSSLRPNDLVWNYVGANYLRGEDPPPFDLLYWNGDSTNLPGPMFCWYLRNTYLENKLKNPGALTVCGEKLDLGKIAAPTFIYASREDHIVPWTSAYLSTGILNPKKKAQNRFILGASGHIAGVVNPPAKKKRNYWSNSALPATAQEWFEGAKEHPGSWWPEWAAFLAKHGGKMVAAPRTYGKGQYKAIEAAPGRYVKQKAE